MKRRNRLRRTTALAALSCAVALGPAAAAHADQVTVPGCFGLEPNIYCNVTVTYELPVDAEVVPTTREACAGDCYDVPFVEVTTTPNAEPRVCVDATDRGGSPNLHLCQPLPGGGYGTSQCTGSAEWGVVVETPDGDVPVCRQLVVERPGIWACPGGGFGIYDPNTGFTAPCDDPEA